MLKPIFTHRLTCSQCKAERFLEKAEASETISAINGQIAIKKHVSPDGKPCGNMAMLVEVLSGR